MLYNHVSLLIEDVKDNTELAKPTIVRSCLLHEELCELHSVMKMCIHISSSSSQVLQPMQGLDRLNHKPPSISIHGLRPPIPDS